MINKIAALLKKSAFGIFLSLILGLLVGAIVMAIAGYNPVEAYGALLSGIFSRPKYIIQVIIKSTPIILTGLSVAFAFKTGLFNIGAEGQYIIGTITAALIGYHLKLPPVIHFIVVVVAAMFFAGCWGGIAGFLKSKFGIHEVITTIMLNWIALYLNNFIITLPGVKKPGTEASFEALKSAWCVILGSFKTSSSGKEFFKVHPVLSDMILKTDFNYGILIAIIMVIIISFVLKKTTHGFELRSVGLNKDAAEFAGINVKKNIFMAMFIAGAIAGLAGALQITGTMPHRITVLAAPEGYGFDGIIVALIAASNPIGCIFSGFLFGALKYGGSSIQSAIGAPSEIINIVMGTIVFFIGMSAVFPMLGDLLKKKGAGKLD